MEGTVNADYAAAPVRITITDKDGKVVYYAGPGPFDFKIEKIERALIKVVAGNGYMPPPPPIQWGPAVNGLKYGMAIDPPQVKVGNDVVVVMQLENTTTNPINLAFDTNTAAQNIEIKNSNGRKLALQTAAAGGIARITGGRSRQVRPLTIAPGTTYSVELEGKIVPAVEGQEINNGSFTAVASLEVTPEALANVQVAPGQTVWTGKLSTGVCMLDVGAIQTMNCANCHAGSDYHHSDAETDCTKCHIGIVGTEDFATKMDACIQCHPRADEHKYGRRHVLGETGEFSLPSRHLPGEITADTCAICHDTSQHQKGKVLLKFDGKTEEAAATGASSAFCLSCHNGKPPQGIVFPTKAKGSGYDKSQATIINAHGGQTISCGMCHTSHGSKLMSLLKDVHIR